MVCSTHEADDKKTCDRKQLLGFVTQRRALKPITGYLRTRSARTSFDVKLPIGESIKRKRKMKKKVKPFLSSIGHHPF